VTQHLRRDHIQLHIDQTVGEALEGVRRQPPEGRIIYFYVVDSDNRLCGVVPTRRLLLSPPDKRIAEIMVGRVIAIPSMATVLDACEFFTLHRFLAFPVVDEDNRLLGSIDAELYTEELSELEAGRFSDDLFQLIGVHVTQAQQAGSLVAFRYRFPWLLCNIAGGIMAAFLSGIYRRELALRDAALALFIAVVLALAESVSIQSLTLALEGMHGRRLGWRDLLGRLYNELWTGAFLGVASGLLVGLVALAWLGELEVALCLLGGIGGGVTCAALFGLSIPNLLRLLDRDPQVAAGPIALAASDLATLLIYFNLARWLLAG
jgi:magnesium transporter